MSDSAVINPAAPLDRLAGAELVIAAATLNDADTIGLVLREADRSVRTLLGDRYAVLLSDGGSTDGTREIAQSSLREPQRLVTITHMVPPGERLSGVFGAPGRAAALQGILQAVLASPAKACVLLDASQPPSPGETVHLITQALMDGHDYVAPVYQRRRYEGSLVSGLVYPLLRACYGQRLRNPLGGDIGASRRLLEHCARIELERLPEDVDLWLATEAMTANFSLAEAQLGPRLRTTAEAPELSAVIGSLLRSVFTDMEHRAASWQRVRTSQAVPVYGQGTPVPLEAAPPPTGMWEHFRLGFQSLREIWGRVLPPANMLELKKLSVQPEDRARFADPLWARIVYDFALAWRQRLMDRGHLLQALAPLYLGWLGSYIRETQELPDTALEDRMERLCAAFEAEKPYLISRWRWPDRFNP